MVTYPNASYRTRYVCEKSLPRIYGYGIFPAEVIDMATMVNRKVWWIGAASIQEGVVTEQHFNPDFLKVRADGGSWEEVKSDRTVFLTPQAAIDEAREVAYLLESSAKNLEASLEDE
jgi:hypothetical protein